MIIAGPYACNNMQETIFQGKADDSFLVIDSGQVISKRQYEYSYFIP